MRNDFRTLFAFICAVLLYTGCEPSFNPIKKNDRYFSVFGYLNASADTQYVRIEKLRDGMATNAPGTLDVEVTLKNMETGQSEFLQDSLFHYYQQGNAHNFYTSMEINPTQKYRLEVDGEEGTSSAEVEIPDSFPEPEVLVNDDFRTEIKMSRINKLIAVKTIFHTCTGDLGCGCTKPTRYIYSHLNDTLQMNDGSVKASINLLDEKKKIFRNFPPNENYYIVRYDIVVAEGMPSWPDFANLDPEMVALPHMATNINGGVGYLAGIVSDTLNISDTCTVVSTDNF